VWTVLLAGGEGRDFGDFSVHMFGNSIPKQFWSLDGTGGMMGWALARARRLAPKEHMIAITRADHARWAAPRFRDLPPENVLVEPADRGSAPGLFLALTKITQADPEAIVVLLPCDHHVEEERVLSEAILDAASVAAASHRIVLLGAAADGTGAECAWILPKGERRASRGAPRAVGCILNHHELPATDRLARDGAFVSTGIVVASGASLVAQFAATVPDLVRECVGHMIETRDERGSLEALYEGLSPRDFNRDVLNGSPESLAVARIPTCGWTDLGTPAKLQEFLRDRVIACPKIVPHGAGKPARTYVSRSGS
jgi:mannose-1-phosphate guanylyltransferase